MIVERTTKYTAAVQSYMAKVGHATNAQILRHLKLKYPELSATTVHRITSRMLARDELHIAPIANDNVMRFDSKLAPHDHFQCLSCDRLRDVVLPKEVHDAIQDLMGDCKLNGQLTVQGSCNKCLKHMEEI